VSYDHLDFGSLMLTVPLLLHLAVANQKAKYLGKKLNKIVKDQDHSEPFEFHNQGSLAYIGDWYDFVFLSMSGSASRSNLTGKLYTNVLKVKKREHHSVKNMDELLGCSGDQLISR